VNWTRLVDPGFARLVTLRASWVGSRMDERELPHFVVTPLSRVNEG